MKFVLEKQHEGRNKTWYASKAVAYFQCCGSNVEEPVDIEFHGRTNYSNTMKIVRLLKQEAKAAFAPDDEYPSVRIVYKSSLDCIVDEHIVWVEF